MERSVNIFQDSGIFLVTHCLMKLEPNWKKFPQNSGKQIWIPEGMKFHNLFSTKSENVAPLRKITKRIIKRWYSISAFRYFFFQLGSSLIKHWPLNLIKHAFWIWKNAFKYDRALTTFIKQTNKEIFELFKPSLIKITKNHRLSPHSSTDFR